MKIALLSDTHVYDVSPWFEAVYERFLASADVLVHCGDMCSFPVWSYLCQHPQFHAVAGNCDDGLLTAELDTRVSFRFDTLTVGVVHGYGYKSIPKLSANLAEAFGPDFDLVCFGHTHKPEWERYGRTWVANPGSMREGSYDPTLAYVHLESDGLRYECIHLPATRDAVLAS